MLLTQTIDLSILAQLQAYQHCDRWVVAYSGGIDSTVLLNSVVVANQHLTKAKPVIALHVNHQLSPLADQWQQHCQCTAQALHIECITQTVNVQHRGKGTEAAARDARYQVFDRYLQAGDCLLLGQHQNDQAETLLFRLLRGAGVKGLAAIPASRSMGNAMLLRPLLSHSREDIEQYAEKNQLQWIDDQSNTDEQYDRNYLRHQVVPMLRQRWPSVAKQLAATAMRMRETDQLLEQLAQSDLQKVDLQEARYGTSIDIHQLFSLSQPLATGSVNFSGPEAFNGRVKNLLRYWCLLSHYPAPENEHLEQINKQLLNAEQALSSACIAWQQVEMRLFNGRLYLMPTLPRFTVPSSAMQWQERTTIDLGSAGVLQWVTSNSLHSDNKLALAPGSYTVCWRQGGERCTPSGRRRSQTVKKLLQEYGLETWLRDRVPLIYDGNILAAVGDLWVCKGYENPSNITGIVWLQNLN